MKQNSSIFLEFLDNIITTDTVLDSRNTSYFPENNILNNNIGKLSKTDIFLKSIVPKASTINDVLGFNVEYNDDIYIFEITGVTYSSTTITWKIFKNIKQIKDLFEQIKKEMSKRDFVDENIILKCKLVKKYTNGEMYRNLKKISEYLIEIYNSTNPNQPESIKEALRISKISFSDSTGIKPFEGYALKKAEPRIMRSVLKYLLFPIEYLFFNGWNKRWIVLKNDMISYLNSPNTLVGKNVYWFDEDIKISTVKDKILKIQNLSRTLELKFDSRFERDLWQKEVESRVEIKKNEIMDNIYHSFTSQKKNCGAKWFVDADSYFSYLFEQLKNAKESVFITDWFLSPQLALVRPINYNEYRDENYKKNLNFSNVSRLMDILFLLAKKGVKVFILLFCEVKLALAINSLYTKEVLKNMHDNIKITRHPKGTSSILWSHHEKLVIIDQKIAFVGGLDLCWGRYDTSKHPIVEEENESHTYYYPGSDYINERQVDLHEVEKFYNEQLNRNKMPRMAWHDVHTMVEGPIVSDIVRHFVERWNYARFNKRNNALVNVGPRESQNEKNKKNKKDIEIQNQLNKTNVQKFKRPSKTLKTNEINNINKIVTHIDNIKEESDSDEEKDEDELNTINTIKSNKIEEEYEEEKDEEKDEEDKKNNVLFRSIKNMNIKKDDDFPIYKDDDKFKDFDDENILPEKNRFTLFSSIKNKIHDKYEDYKSKHGKSKKMKIKQSAFLTDDYEKKDQTIEMDFKIQALRSVSQWSIGKTITEQSILEGYYKLIDNSKHYIYIENQFFITKSFSEEERKKSGLNLNRLVENEIGLHIRTRIERAYEEKANFKVFICIPLLPGFSGTPGESSTMNCILKHTYQSIAHNKGMSLLELLRKKMGDDVNKYIFFYSLRNHGTIKGVPVTELIYIHSKLLIVDDEKVLLGSANINDRSMLGNRDSEFAVIIEEEPKIQSVMDGKKYTAANYALSLRKHLMAEHLGLNEDDKLLDDPLNHNLWTDIRSKANVNSAIYNNIFDCFPDNKFNNFAKLKERKIIKSKEDKQKIKEDYEKKIIGILGHIVEYPIEFLKDEELDIDFFSKENLVPEKNFV